MVLEMFYVELTNHHDRRNKRRLIIVILILFCYRLDFDPSKVLVFVVHAQGKNWVYVYLVGFNKKAKKAMKE